MKILFDHEAFSIQRVGGVSRYFSELIYRLTQKKNIEINLDCNLTNNFYLTNIKNSLNQNIKSINVNSKLIYFFNNLLSVKKKCDIFHKTYYSTNFSKKLPLIITVHDLISEKYLHISNSMKIDSKKKKINIDKADHIIAVSIKTKKDLIKYYRVDPKKISVVHHGYNFISNNEKKKVSINFKKPFFLFIGNRFFYKNFNIILQTFSKYRDLLLDFDLICAGSKNFTVQELKFLKENNIKIDSIKILNQVDDSDLIYLYKNATSLLFPSFEEGFGMPILEALSNNCPVICSDIEVFREIYKDNVYYFDPNDPKDLYLKINQLLLTRKNNNFKNYKLKSFLNDFTWEKTIDSTIKVYEKL